jgi:hypothetical protein
VSIAALVAALALHLLRRDVIGRAQRGRQRGVRDAPRVLFQGDAEVDDLDAIVIQDHDVLGLQVAVHHAVLVQVVERFADGHGEGHGAAHGQFSLFVEDGTQQPSVDPLDHHVEAAALFAVVGLHHAGVVDLLADLLLAPEALEQNRIFFHLRVRRLERHRPAGAQVRGAEERGHAGARDLRVQAVVVQGFSNFELVNH